MKLTTSNSDTVRSGNVVHGIGARPYPRGHLGTAAPFKRREMPGSTHFSPPDCGIALQKQVFRPFPRRVDVASLMRRPVESRVRHLGGKSAVRTLSSDPTDADVLLARMRASQRKPDPARQTLAAGARQPRRTRYPDLANPHRRAERGPGRAGHQRTRPRTQTSGTARVDPFLPNHPPYRPAGTPGWSKYSTLFQQRGTQPDFRFSPALTRC